jgi:hypothetical protein
MYEEEILGGIMDGSNPEMKRLRRMLAASRAMDQPPSPAGNRAIAETTRQGYEGDMEINEVISPEPAAVEQPSAAPPPPKPAPPAPAPMMSPKLGPRFSFDPRTPQADEYKGIVQDYQGNRMAGELPGTTYKDPTGLTRNVPQVYGQEGSPADPDEGPRTPEETAAELNRIETSVEGGKGGLELHRKQHTLGYGLGFGPKNAKRRQAYDSYVQQSRAKQDAERTARQERAFANRADIRDRDALTMQKMADYNSAIQGGGRMGSYDNSGPTVGRVGGIGFIRGAGRFRPADSMEQVEMANKQAQGDYMRSRPMDMAQDNQRQMLELQRKLSEDQNKQKRFMQSFQQREQFFNQGMAHRKQIEQRIAAGQTAELAQDAGQVAKRMETFAQMMRVKLEAAKKSTGLFGMGGPNPAAKDAWIDPQTMQADLDNIVPGDFDKIKDALATEIETLTKINPQAQLPESVQSVLQMMQGA